MRRKISCHDIDVIERIKEKNEQLISFLRHEQIVIYVLLVIMPRPNNANKLIKRICLCNISIPNTYDNFTKLKKNILFKIKVHKSMILYQCYFTNSRRLKGGVKKVGPFFTDQCSKGAFNNYVDRILPFFDPLPPHLIHVVIEWPKSSVLKV